MPIVQSSGKEALKRLGVAIVAAPIAGTTDLCPVLSLIGSCQFGSGQKAGGVDHPEYCIPDEQLEAFTRPSLTRSKVLPSSPISLMRRQALPTSNNVRCDRTAVPRRYLRHPFAVVVFSHPTRHFG